MCSKTVHFFYVVLKKGNEFLCMKEYLENIHK